MDVKPMSRARKLLDGWQVGLVAIFTAVICCLVAVPRPVLLDDIPCPIPNMRSLSVLSRLDETRAERFASSRPPYDVRALGEAIRRYGLVDAAGDSERRAQSLTEITRLVPSALATGDEPVLDLRAYHLQGFLRELQRFSMTGVESPELRELAGGIVDLLQRDGWMRREGQQWVIVPERPVLEALFRKRWNEITGLKRSQFAPALDEHRALYGFLLTHPVVRGSLLARDRSTLCRVANEYLLKKVGELGAVDPDYPTEIAQAVLNLRMGRSKQAADTLVRYLDRKPDGAYSLRARNTLREAERRLLELGR